jgi:hypothetical protein
MFIDMITVNMMQVPLVKVIGVDIVHDGFVSAT